MDRLDLKIIAILGNDCRTSFRKIGKEIGLTIPSVKARVNKMIDSGVITGFITRVNPAIFGYHSMLMLQARYSGQTGDEIANRLNLLGDVAARVQHVGGVSTFVVAIKNGNEEKVGLLVNSLKLVILRHRLIRRPNAHSIPICLNKTDFKIIGSLIQNPRIGIADIATQISASGKTVARRLERLRKNNLLKFSVALYPAAMKGYIPIMMNINIDPEQSRNILEKIYSELRDYFLFIPPLANQNNTIVLILVCENIYIVDYILSKVESFKGVKEAEVFFISKINFYNEWIRREVNRMVQM